MIRALFRRDLTVAIRAGGGIGLGLAFFLVFVLISALGVGRNTENLAIVAPGVLWSGALLATLLSLDRLFQADYEDGSLEAMTLTAPPLATIVITKTLAHWLTTGVPLVILSPVMALMLHLPYGAFGWMMLSLFLGTLSMSAIGAIGAALTLGIRRGGLLMSLLVMPLFIPTLIFGVSVVQDAARGETPVTPLTVLAGLTLMSLALSPLATSWALRVNMR